MSRRGYVALHRKFDESPIFKNEKTLKLFVYCLLKATHTDYTAVMGNQFVELKPGQFVSGIKIMTRDLDWSEQTFKTVMKNIKKLDFLTSKSTNKFTIYTVVNWEKYQQPNQQTNQQPNQPTTNEQPHTRTSNNNNNNKAFKKPTEKEIEDHFISKNVLPELALSEAKRFIEYYEEVKWVSNKKPMTSWKLAASGWNNRRVERETNSRHQGQSAAARTAENIQKEFRQTEAR
jgi:hypothetical protein